MSERKDEFENDFDENDFDEDIPKEEFDDDIDIHDDDDDLFEDEAPPPPKKKNKNTKKGGRRPPKKNTQATESKQGTPLTKYLLFGIVAVCVIGGGLWMFMPFFMSGNSNPYSSQNFQTQTTPQPAPQVTQAPQAQNQALFVDEQPQPVSVAQPSSVNQQPAFVEQTPSATTAAVQPYANQEREADKQFAEIQKMMKAQKKQLERLNELEKLEKIYLAVQKMNSRAPADGNLVAENKALKAEKDKLLGTMDSLKAENKDLKGKNIYLRHLHSEQKAEIESLENQLAQKKNNTNNEDRFLGFMNTWQLTGLTTNFVIFRNTKNSAVVRVGRGDAIDGVRILSIDSYAGIIKTSEGDIMFNAG